jgi:PTS system nitrogen regulatory IIA component
MEILDLLKKETISIDLKSKNKRSVLNELVAPIADIYKIQQDKIVKVLLEREKLGSTGIGDGIGIPHGRLQDIDSFILGFGISKQGVDFDSMDGKPAYIFFLLITPLNSTGTHLRLLSKISKIMKNEIFREKLINARNSDEILSLIQKENEKN